MVEEEAQFGADSPHTTRFEIQVAAYFIWEKRVAEGVDGDAKSDYFAAIAELESSPPEAVE